MSHSRQVILKNGNEEKTRNNSTREVSRETTNGEVCANDFKQEEEAATEGIEMLLDISLEQ